ncbi:MAG: OpgC domain-containing protein [Mesorhizobium sp.]
MDTRLHQIDLVRGFCLLNIFINHITISVLQEASPSKLFLFDSADAFVFLSGISVMLAYGGSRRPADQTRQLIWKRALHLYKVNLLVILASAGILCLGYGLAQVPMLADHPVQLVGTHGVASYLWHVLTMQQTVGYSMVLRLYVFLMLVAPLYVWLASRRFWFPLLVAVPVWLLAGGFGLVESDALSGTPLRLTVLPWNLPFAAGIVLGAAIVAKIELPRSRVLDVIVIVIAAVLPVGLALASSVDQTVLEWLDKRDEHFLFGASKTLQSPLRILSLVCAAYLLMRFTGAPVVRLLHGVGPANVLCHLGRRSLSVFALGAVLALAANQILAAGHFRFGFETGGLAMVSLEIVLVLAGFLAMALHAGWRPSLPRSAGPGSSAAFAPSDLPRL